MNRDTIILLALGAAVFYVLFLAPRVEAVTPKANGQELDPLSLGEFATQAFFPDLDLML